MEDEAELTGATPRRRPKPDILEIDGRRLKPATLMMGHGFDPALSEGSLKPPVFLTSTWTPWHGTAPAFPPSRTTTPTS